MPTDQLSDLMAFPAWSGGPAILLAKATLILVAALAITRAMHRASAGARHLVWLVTLVALLLVPALTAWAPLEIRVLPPNTPAAHLMNPRGRPALQQADRAAATNVHIAVAAVPAAIEVAAAPGPIRRALASVQSLSGIALVAAIWAAVAVLILCSLGWSALTVRRIVSRARALDTEAWRAPLLEVADRLGLDEPPRLLVSRDTRMPFACGVIRPTIVLPDEGCAWSQDRRRAVLLHELAHVRRRDLVGHMLGRLVCAFYWFHPLVWVAAKRLRSESERACDDLAVACGTRATDYAEHLLDIVTAVRTLATPAAALAMARRKEFEGRMLAILDPELRHSTPSRGQSAALIASLMLGAGLLAAAAPARRSVHGAPVPVVQDVRSAPPVHESTPAAARHEESLVPRVMTNRTTPHQSEPLAGASDRDAVSNADRDIAGATPARPITEGASRADQQGPDDRPALLAKVLRTDSSAKLRRIAAWGLQEYSPSPAATDALINAVTHDADAEVREMAAWSLANYEHGHDVTDVLGAALRGDRKEEVRVTAAWALGTIGSDAAAEALTVALTDSSAKVRSVSAWALGTIQPNKAPAALVAMLRDRDKEARQLAAWALYQLEDPTALPGLEAALRTESDQETQLAYIRAMAVMGEKSVDAIRGLLESPDSSVRSMAVRALAGGHAMEPWPWPWPEPRPNPD